MQHVREQHLNKLHKALVTNAQFAIWNSTKSEQQNTTFNVITNQITHAKN